MKALILVGGFGTRLRPLTLVKPKPLVDFCNKPTVEHQIAALAKAGVNHVILAVGFQPAQLQAGVAGFEEKYGIKITCVREEEPLGTAGPLALSAELLREDSDPFFVLNSDVVCEYPLTKLLEYHRSHGKEGTILAFLHTFTDSSHAAGFLTTQVQEPSRYGVVVSKDGRDEGGAIQRFVEKPKEFVGNKINAGIYVFNSGILDRIPLRPCSIEKEIFPQMASSDELHSMVLEGFWMDVGKPEDFLRGGTLYLESLRRKSPSDLASGANIVGNVLVDASAKIGSSCVIGPNVSIGANCVIEDGVRLKNCTVMSGARVGSHSLVQDSIIGWDSKIGKWCFVEGNSVLSEDVTIADLTFIRGAKILQHKEVKESCYESKVIM